MTTLPARIATAFTSKGWNPRVIRAASRAHRFLFRSLRLGRFRLVGAHALVLTTRGRRTGRDTSTPLFYAQERAVLYVTATFAGSGRSPNWFLNLVAHPDVAVDTGRVRGPYRARVLDDAEAARVWPMLDAIYPTYAVYRRRTAGTFRVVELTPLGDDAISRTTRRADRRS